MKYLLSIFCCWVLVIGCKDKQATSNAPANSKDNTAAAKAPITSEYNAYEGLYIGGPSKQTFIDCQSGKTYWLASSTKGLLTQRYPMLNARPYEPTFVQVRAKMESLPKNLADSTGLTEQLVVSEVLKTSNRPEANCFNTELVIRSTQPRWAMIVTNKGVFFKDAISNSYQTLAYQAPIIKGDSVMYALKNAKGEAIEVTAYKKTFNEATAKKSYPYTADIKIGKALYRGFAELPMKEKTENTEKQKAELERRAAIQKAAAERKNK